MKKSMVVCKENVVVNDRLVFEKGEKYPCKTITEGFLFKTKKHEVKSPLGLAVYENGDKLFYRHFKFGK